MKNTQIKKMHVFLHDYLVLYHASCFGDGPKKNSVSTLLHIAHGSTGLVLHVNYFVNHIRGHVSHRTFVNVGWEIRWLARKAMFCDFINEICYESTSEIQKKKQRIKCLNLWLS